MIILVVHMFIYILISKKVFSFNLLVYFFLDILKRTILRSVMLNVNLQILQWR